MTLYDHRGELLTREEMTTLEYILYDQCNSRKFGPIEPERRALEGELEKIYIANSSPLNMSLRQAILRS